jgi:hypothetical protein
MAEQQLDDLGRHHYYRIDAEQEKCWKTVAA